MRCACLFAFAMGCASSGPDLDRATLAHLSYGVPAGWSSKDLTTPSRAMIEWTPSDNERKETITIIRAQRPALAKHGEVLGRWLVKAGEKIPNSWFGIPARFATKHGLVGARIEGAFTPPGQSITYRRLHGVLVDGEYLLHVIYTGRELDREVFEAVVDSIQGA